jgi:Flp pilus assembly pilin Flp
MRAAASNLRRTVARAAVLRDESGVGVAEYSAMLSLFAVQCVVGALVVSRNVDHIVQAIRAIF